MTSAARIEDAAPVPQITGVKPLSDAEFRLFQKLVYDEAGIFLSDVKRALLVGRLARRLRVLSCATFRDYYDHVVSHREDELPTMLDCICTNETQFFREPPHFELLSTRIFPAWREQAAQGLRKKTVRVWSAGCSTGEEPYSLAMVLLEAFPASDGWQVQVIATDLSNKALDRARAGLWNIERAQSIPAPLLKRFMLRGVGAQEGKMKAGDEVRTVIELARLNLNDEHYAVAGPFDLVFCRNVLIYFNTESRAGVIRRLLANLAPDGYLFLGHAETLNGLTDAMRSVIPTVYTRGPAGRRRDGT